MTRGRFVGRLLAVVGAAVLSVAAAVPAHAAAPRLAGARCLVGHWKLDVPQLVSSVPLPGTTTGSGTVDLTFSRTGKYLQVYADTISSNQELQGGTLGVEIKFNGAVSASYRATADQLTLRNVENATSEITTQYVNGNAVGSKTTEPAFGTIAPGGSVTLPYTCRNDAATITNTGGVVWHLNRTSSRT